jgi:hypothetical protein
MKVPIDAILSEGWSLRTAIDYQEVKGPVFFWMYAIPCEIIGDSINAMRLVSIAYFAGGAIALLLIASRCGLRRGWLIAVAGLYCLSPYNAFVAQLLMSEPSFNFLALWAVYVFIRAFESSQANARRWRGPLAFGILLTLLLHHRPHAVAIAGAVAVAAFQRGGFRAWPWWVACFVAGLLRLPLYARWGGMVTSHYQDLFGFGFRAEGLAYLLGAMLPWTGAWIIAPLTDSTRSRASTLAILMIACAAGVLVGVLATPDLDAKVRYVLPGETEFKQQAEFAGAMTTALKTTVASGFARDAALAILAGLGAASVAGFALVAFRRNSHGTSIGGGSGTRTLVLHLSFWMLACGVPLYVFTAGPVYDRYLMVWAVLLPIAWAVTLPRLLLVIQSLVHAGMVVSLANDWLMQQRVPPP